MDMESELRRMGFDAEQIATATVDGKPLSSLPKKTSLQKEKLNKTELLYDVELAQLHSEGVVARWWAQSVRLRLADKTTYTPDFLVQFADGRLVFVEIKGFLRDDASVKFKVAREMYPWAEFVMLRRVKKQWVPVKI